MITQEIFAIESKIAQINFAISKARKDAKTKAQKMNAEEAINIIALPELMKAENQLAEIHARNAKLK